MLSWGQGIKWSVWVELPLPLGLTLSLVESALHFLVLSLLHIFHLYSNTCPTKHVSPNTSGTKSIVKSYVSKDCLFLPFWTLISGRILSLVTANPRPVLPMMLIRFCRKRWEKAREIIAVGSCSYATVNVARNQRWLAMFRAQHKNVLQLNLSECSKHVIDWSLLFIWHRSDELCWDFDIFVSVQNRQKCTVNQHFQNFSDSQKQDSCFQPNSFKGETRTWSSDKLRFVTYTSDSLRCLTCLARQESNQSWQK